MAADACRALPPNPPQVAARRSASLGSPALRRATPGGRRLPSRGVAVSAAVTDPAEVADPAEEVDVNLPLEADINVLLAWREQCPELKALWDATGAVTAWEGVTWGEGTTGQVRGFGAGNKAKIGPDTGRVVKIDLNR